MDLTKFLLIDASLMLGGFALLWIFQANKAKAFILDEFKGIEAANKPAINLPDQNKLLELERIARKDGSGITSDSLIGGWNFISVWKQKKDKEDLIASALLRFFSASLEIKQGELNEFSITNSIQFGLLSILFIGSGNLKGKQPLLPFFFECIQLKAGSTVLFARSLEIPGENNRPFFALISMGKDGKWLSARGRGGGLALWVRDQA